MLVCPPHGPSATPATHPRTRGAWSQLGNAEGCISNDQPGLSRKLAQVLHLLAAPGSSGTPRSVEDRAARVPQRACRQRRLLRQLSQRVAIADHDPPQLDRGQLFQIQAGHGRRRNFRGTLSSLSPSSNRTSHAPFPCTFCTTPLYHLAAKEPTCCAMCLASTCWPTA